MRYSAIAALVSSMLRNFGDPDPEKALQFIEICAGNHHLTDAHKSYGIASDGVDV